MKTLFTSWLIFTGILAISQSPLPDYGPLFLQDELATMRIEIDQDSLDQMLLEENWYSNHEYPATFIYETSTASDTIENVGFRLRGNTSRQAWKKSFKVSINSFIPGQKIHGVEKINLNGHQNDPSLMRAKLAWDAIRSAGIIGCRVSFVKLYVNDEYKGLYSNVEHIDEEFADLYFGNNSGDLFKCIYPADLNYWGSDPDVYKEEFWGRRAYQLKTNTAEDDYSNLAHFIDVLNNSSDDDFQCEIENIFDVGGYLKQLALEILFAQWDGYSFNKNNFYLYQNPSTGLFEFIHYDLDNTFGIDWFDQNWSERDVHNWSSDWEYRPLYERIMEVDSYREQYNYYLDLYATEFFNEASISLMASSYYDQISDAALEDEYRPLDYGFSADDFINAFDEAWGYHVPVSISEYVVARHNSLDWYIDETSIPLALHAVTDNGPQPSEVSVTALVIGDYETISLEYSIDGGAWLNETMLDDGLNNDGQADDGVFGFTLTAGGGDQYMEYQVVAENSDLSITRPCEPRWVWISESDSPIVINELMSNNVSVVDDELGEFDDWIELHNPTQNPISLSNMYLSDNVLIPDKWPVPDVTLNAGDWILFWADSSPEQGALHCNFGLDAAGESLRLVAEENDALRIVDHIDFAPSLEDESWGRAMDASPDWIWFTTPTPDSSNNTVNITNPKESAFHIWPNPTSERLHMSHPASGRVTTLTGNIVLTFSNTNMIQLGKLATGLYILHTDEHVIKFAVR